MYDVAAGPAAYQSDMTHTPASLIAFEDRVAAAFEAKQVRGPVHLNSDDQAEPLLNIFADIKADDWKFGTWRGHWVALLSGVPEDEVFAAIKAGRSMFLQFRPYRVLCSAIVGGILPIAVGVAMGIKRRGGHERVHVFVGDMCETTGLFHEAARYSAGHGLPIRFIVEDNGVSTDVPTETVWGLQNCRPLLTRYTYQRNRPHVGTGNRVQFF